MQLTWDFNYKTYGELLDIDLTNNPDLACEPNTALYILVHGFINGTFTDKKLPDYVNSEQKDYVEKLKKHHAAIVAAMKVKQNADMKYVDTLEASIKGLLPYYPEHKH